MVRWEFSRGDVGRRPARVQVCRLFPDFAITIDGPTILFPSRPFHGTPCRGGIPFTGMCPCWAALREALLVTPTRATKPGDLFDVSRSELEFWLARGPFDQAQQYLGHHGEYRAVAARRGGILDAPTDPRRRTRGRRLRHSAKRQTLLWASLPPAKLPANPSTSAPGADSRGISVTGRRR